MRVVIQRVLKSSVSTEGNIIGEIGKGMMVLVGFEDADGEEDISWMAKKIVALRIFDDQSGVMNLSIKEINGNILLISQFTLMASTKKGNRPSYIFAAKPDISIPLYEKFKKVLSQELGRSIECGKFGAQMEVSLINEGPVTICIDSKNRI